MATKEEILDVLKAIRKNGYEKVKGSYFHYEGRGLSDRFTANDKVVGGCALGQGALNYELEPLALCQILRAWVTSDRDIPPRPIYKDQPVRLPEFITALNDYTELTIPEIADIAEKAFLKEFEE
jgi:hypothetical protein